LAVPFLTLSAASPSWAGTSDRVQFEIKPRVVSQIINQVEGETRLLVASNTAFNIRASGMIGDISVKVEETGEVSGTAFGTSAQLPGEVSQQTFLTNPFEAPIYTAKRKTARSSGTPLDQAVLVRIFYAGPMHPTLIVEPNM